MTAIPTAAERATPLSGFLWMAAAATCFAITFAIVRGLSETMHTFQIVLLRNLVGLAILAPWLCRTGIGVLRTGRWRAYGGRAALGYAAMALWFFALSEMPLADATALQFTLPLWTVVLAVIFLGERSAAHRWLATAAGFAGALVIVRPGFVETSWVALCALAAAALYAATNIITKSLARTDDRTAVVFHSFLWGLPFAVPAAVAVWQTPGLDAVPLIAAFGLATAGAHLSLTRALAIADAGAIGPVDYIRLPVVALIGWAAFAELPDLWTWAGAGVIVASTWWLAARERGTRPGATG